ncbi:MAG: FimB/Mfa2 family fimbrial subunit [Odoribacter sp.]
MKMKYFTMILILFLLSCSKDRTEQAVPATGEMTKIAFTLADGSQADTKAVVGDVTNPLSTANISTYIKHVRLLVFNTSDKMLIHEDSWATTSGSYETSFPAVNGTSYDFVVITNTDVAGSFTSPLVKGLSNESTVVTMLKEIMAPQAAAGNGDTGNRYQLYTRASNPADTNHIFYGIKAQSITAGTQNTVQVGIKRVIAMVNFEVDIQNPSFQPSTPTSSPFLSEMTLDVSRMARSLNMKMEQQMQSASGKTDCVVRSGAFTRSGSTGYKYKSTAFVFGNGKKAFLTLNLKTQTVSGLLAAGQSRLFWMDITTTTIDRNKKYNITAVIPAGNFGGDPSQPSTVNPEDPDPKMCNLTVNVSASDWDVPSISGGGTMH